jgi:hypothetical protein
MVTTQPHRRPRPRATLLVLVLGGTLAACSAGGDESTAVGRSVAGDAEQAPAADSAGSAELAVGGTATVDRQVVQTGTVWLTATDPVAAADRTVSLVEALDGRVDDRTSVAGGPDEPASATLVVRVPATGLTALLEDLTDVGEVDRQEIHAEDVTAAAQDLDARIDAMELSVARMEDLLARATTSQDLVTAEQALSERQTSLEQMRSERARLADQVALSTLTVEIGQPGEVPPPAEPAPSGFLGGLGVGWAALVAVVRGVVLVLGVLAPWLALSGAVWAGWVAFSRRRTRRAGVPAGSATSGAGAAPAAVPAAAPAAVPAAAPAPVAHERAPGEDD